MLKKILLSFYVLFSLLMMTACGGRTPESAPTADTQATVNALVAATSAAQAAMQATINASIAGTTTAFAELAAPTPLPSSTPISTNTPIPATPTPIVIVTSTVEVVEMTEEELEALINESVAQAVEATYQASAVTTQATADQTVTQEEIESMEVYVYAAEQAIAYCEVLIDEYVGLYAELATESIAYLYEIEQELATMTTNTAAMVTYLDEMSAAMTAGLELATETITQLESAAQVAAANLEQVKTHTQTWVTESKAAQEARAQAIAAIQPNNIAADQLSALATAFSFVDNLKLALGDNKISRDELYALAQLGANASASLQAHGGPQFSGLSSKISEITGQLARGQTPLARRSLGGLETSLGSRPSLPSLPGGGIKPGGGVQLPGRP